MPPGITADDFAHIAPFIGSNGNLFHAGDPVQQLLPPPPTSVAETTSNENGGIFARNFGPSSRQSGGANAALVPTAPLTIAERSAEELAQRNKRTNEAKEQRLRVEMKQVKGTPEITKRSQQMKRSVGDMMTWEERRKEKIQGLQRQLQAAEDSLATAVPIINKDYKGGVRAASPAGSRRTEPATAASVGGALEAGAGTTPAGGHDSRAAAGADVGSRLYDTAAAHRSKMQAAMLAKEAQAKDMAKPTLTARGIKRDSSIDIGTRLHGLAAATATPSPAPEPVSRPAPKISSAASTPGASSVGERLHSRGLLSAQKTAARLEAEEMRVRLEAEEAVRVNPRSERILKQAGALDEPTHTRLAKPIGSLKVRTRKELERDEADKLTFKPKIVTGSGGIASRAAAAGSPHVSSSMYDHERGRGSDTRVQGQARGRSPFGAGSGSVSVKRSGSVGRSGGGSQKNPPVSRRHHSASPMGRQATGTECGPTPGGNGGGSPVGANSAAYLRSKKWQEDKERRLQRERAEREAQETSECSFKPNAKPKLRGTSNGSVPPSPSRAAPSHTANSARPPPGDVSRFGYIPAAGSYSYDNRGAGEPTDTMPSMSPLDGGGGGFDDWMRMNNMSADIDENSFMAATPRGRGGGAQSARSLTLEELAQDLADDEDISSEVAAEDDRHIEAYLQQHLYTNSSDTPHATRGVVGEQYTEPSGAYGSEGGGGGGFVNHLPVPQGLFEYDGGSVVSGGGRSSGSRRSGSPVGANSAAYLRSKKWQEDKERRLQRERAEREAQETSECSFKPNAKPKPGSATKQLASGSKPTSLARELPRAAPSRPGGAGSSGGGDMMSRQLEWQKKRDARLEAERVRKQREEMEACTFAPTSVKPTAVGAEKTKPTAAGSPEKSTAVPAQQSTRRPAPSKPDPGPGFGVSESNVISLRELTSMEEYQRNNTRNAPLVPPRLPTALQQASSVGASDSSNSYAFQFMPRVSKPKAREEAAEVPGGREPDDWDACSITSDMLPREAPGSWRARPSQVPVEIMSRTEMKGNISPMAQATKPAPLQPIALPVAPRRRPPPRPHPASPAQPSTPPPPQHLEETPPPPVSHIAYPTPQPPSFPPSPGTPWSPPPIPSLQSSYTPNAPLPSSYIEIQAKHVGDGEDTCQSYELQDSVQQAPVMSHPDTNSVNKRRPVPPLSSSLQVRSNVDLL